MGRSTRRPLIFDRVGLIAIAVAEVVRAALRAGRLLALLVEEQLCLRSPLALPGAQPAKAVPDRRDRGHDLVTFEELHRTRCTAVCVAQACEPRVESVEDEESRDAVVEA